MVKYLIDCNADLLILNKNEKMASQLAYENGFLEISVYFY